MAQVEQNTRSRPLSCLFCRSRQLRCSRQFPCPNCTSRGITCELDAHTASSISSSTEDKSCLHSSTVQHDVLARLSRLEESVIGQGKQTPARIQLAHWPHHLLHEMATSSPVNSAPRSILVGLRVKSRTKARRHRHSRDG